MGLLFNAGHTHIYAFFSRLPSLSELVITCLNMSHIDLYDEVYLVFNDFLPNEGID